MTRPLPSATPRPVDLINRLPQYSRAAGLGRVRWVASSNESPLAPSLAVQDAVREASATGNRYPSLFGDELSTAIAARVGIGDDQVVVGAGSIPLLQQTLLAYSGPGTEVVHAWRSYEAYPMLVTLVGAESVPVPLDVEHRHDPAGLIDAVGPKTQAVIVCNPNNPTGTMLRPEEVRSILDRVPPHVLVVLDEAYREFTGSDIDITAWLPYYPNLVILRTFSKAYGLAGLRAGYLIANTEVAHVVHRTSPPFGLSRTASAAATAAWADEAHTRHVVATACADRERLRVALREVGVSTPESASNFVWLPAGPYALRLEELCNDRGVAVRAFDGEGVRITTGDPEASAACVRAVSDLIAESGVTSFVTAHPAQHRPL